MSTFEPPRVFWLLSTLIGGGACSQESAPLGEAEYGAKKSVEWAVRPNEPIPTVTAADLEAAVLEVPQLSAFVISRAGEIEYEHYADGAAFERPRNIKSASKPIIGALAGIALARGDIASLDTPIAEYLPRYYQNIPPDDARRRITVRHLLTMSSGLPSTSIYNYGAWVSSADWIRYALSSEVVYPPGARMTYSTGDTHLLAAVLTAATGMSLRAFAQRHLFDPLGARIGGWDRDPQGIYFGGNNFALSPSAMVRFGQLYLQEGLFAGERVLSEEWVRASWTPRFPNSSFNTRHDLGYLWWRTDLAGYSTWFAWGYGGQFLLIVPALDAVIVVTRDPDTRSRGGNHFVYALIEDVVLPYLEAVTGGRRTADGEGMAGRGRLLDTATWRE